MNNTNFFLGMQALGGKQYRIRAIENWTRTREGKSAEEWCRNNWQRVRTAILPEAKLEGSWWRFSDDPEGGRKYALNEDSWSFTDHSDEEVKITGIIPTLVYARGNEVLVDLAECAKVTQVFNFPYGIAAPIPSAVLKKSASMDKGADGVWLWRDLDGQVIYKRVRRSNNDSGKMEKRFVTLGSTCGHWVEEDGKKQRVDARAIAPVKMINNCSPWYGMEKILQRWNHLKGIVIVEGEKSCDKGQEWLDKLLLEEGQQISSWITLTPGPSAMFKNVDMYILDQLAAKGLEILVWPDRDNAGLKAATKLQKREKRTGSIKVWNTVMEYPMEDGWDVADIPDDYGFQTAWKLLIEQSSNRYQIEANQNTLEVPEHGYGFIKGTTQFVNLETLVLYDKAALDMVLRQPTGKNRPSIRFVEEESEKTPFIDRLHGFNYKEGRIYRDEQGMVWVNRYTPIQYQEIPEAELSDRELEEEVEWFTAHADYLIGDENVKDKFLDWMAFNIQQPGVKIHHAILLQGVQGTGKSFLAKCLWDILGKNCYIMPAIDLQRKWNAFYSDVSLIVAEELMKGGRDAREFSNHVKHLITGETIDIEEKYRVTEKGIQNHVNFMFLTNYEDSIEIDASEDRYLVHFSTAQPMDPTYYAHLHSKLKDPRCMQHLYTWFLRRDLREYSAGNRAFITNSLHRLKNESIPTWQSQLDFMISTSLSPFEDGHAVIHVQPLLLHLQNVLGLRNIGRTAVRNFLRKKGYVSTPNDPYILLPQGKAKIAGITEEELKPNIDELLAVIQGRTLTSKQMQETIQEVYNGVWKKSKIYPLLYSKGWAAKPFTDGNGGTVRKWYDAQQ